MKFFRLMAIGMVLLLSGLIPTGLALADNLITDTDLVANGIQKTMNLGDSLAPGASFTDIVRVYAEKTGSPTPERTYSPSLTITFNASATGLTGGGGSITTSGVNNGFDSTVSGNVPMTPGAFSLVVRWEALLADGTDDSRINDPTATMTYTGTVVAYTLTITAVNGTVVKSPNKTYYTSGDVVTLTANPDDGYHFENWTGDLTGTTSPANITMNADKSVMANFAADTPSNRPPTVTPSNLSVTVDEGSTATNTGTVSDPDDDTVGLSASVGTVTNNGDGTWSWSFATTDGPDDSDTVTIYADDGNGGTASVDF